MKIKRYIGMSMSDAIQKMRDAQGHDGAVLTPHAPRAEHDGAYAQALGRMAAHAD